MSRDAAAPRRPAELLLGPWAPLLAGLATALTVWWIWGSLRAVPLTHDESAYALQARIFATGHWTAPGRPLPEFFEQTHVFVTPVLASKYPPAHSLALVPGFWIGLPGIVPVLLNGLVGALVFLLARRLEGPFVALVTWLVWLTAPGALAFRASYLSECTSSALWLLGWWFLLRWKESGEKRHLAALALCVGCGFLTRPLTMVAFSLPVGVVVLREVARRRAWRDLVLPSVLGALVLGVVPLWSFETLGGWRTTPYRQYSRVYYPYQWAGFTFDETPALRAHPPEMEPFDRDFRRIQREHRLPALPGILWARLTVIVRDVFGGGREFLIAFAVLGILGASAELVFALMSFGVLILAYLVFAHVPSWSVYYLEGHPVLAFATARGLWRVLSGLSNRLARAPAARAAFGGWALTAVILAGLIAPATVQLQFIRNNVQEKLVEQTSFRKAVDSIADRKSIVFVRHALGHDPHRELISNEPDLASARSWIVYDRGPKNADLLRLAPERAPYLYDEAHRRLAPLIGPRT